MQQPLPSFWVPHNIVPGETLNSIARSYRYTNPGPIISFNCTRLPNAMKDWKPEARFEKKVISDALLRWPSWDQMSITNRAIYIRHHIGWGPLNDNQVTTYELRQGPSMEDVGNVITVVDSYPINRPLSVNETPFLLIPWRRVAINQSVSQLKQLKRDIEIQAMYVINGNRKALEQLKGVLFTVDFLATVLKCSVGLLSLGIKSATTEVDTAKMAKEVYKLIGKRSIMYGKAVAQQMDREFEKEVHEQLRNIRLQPDFSFWLDNTVGWLSPSKWTSLFVSMHEHDMDILFYGPKAVEVKWNNKAVEAAREEIKRTAFMIQWAQQAAHAAFYRHVVADSEG